MLHSNLLKLTGCILLATGKDEQIKNSSDLQFYWPHVYFHYKDNLKIPI